MASGLAQFTLGWYDDSGVGNFTVGWVNQSVTLVVGGVGTSSGWDGKYTMPGRIQLQSRSSKAFYDYYRKLEKKKRIEEDREFFEVLPEIIKWML